MTTIELVPLDGHRAVETVKSIYLRSFPACERRPWPLIAGAHATGCPEAHVIEVGGRAAGIITTWHFAEFVYIEHFAVDPSLRGHGIGAHIIALLRRTVAPLPLLLEAEHPDDDTLSDSSRRVRFYERLGFNILSRDYIQPPYTPDGDSVPLLLMATSALDADAAAHTLHTHVYDKSTLRTTAKAADFNSADV